VRCCERGTRVASSARDGADEVEKNPMCSYFPLRPMISIR
jgi:hypothetical protein